MATILEFLAMNLAAKLARLDQYTIFKLMLWIKRHPSQTAFLVVLVASTDCTFLTPWSNEVKDVNRVYLDDFQNDVD